MLVDPTFLGALPVQGGVGFDVDNLVGLAIVFFAVIWPVIRGLLNVAKSNRQDFQAKSRGGPQENQSSALDLFLEGLREDEDEDEDFNSSHRRAARRAQATGRNAEMKAKLDRGGARAATRAERPGPAVDPFGEAEASTIAPKPKPKPKPVPKPVPEAPRVGLAAAGRGSELSGGRPDGLRAPDPVGGFPVAIDETLDDIPSESALEAGRFELSASAGQRRPEREPDEEGLEVLAGEGERAAFALDSKRSSPLDRIQSGRSPWQTAILMKEVLGPPISVTPHHDQQR